MSRPITISESPWTRVELNTPKSNSCNDGFQIYEPTADSESNINCHQGSKEANTDTEEVLNSTNARDSDGGLGQRAFRVVQHPRTRSSDPLGLTVIHEPGLNASVDIVFVHGLGGSSHATWTDGQDPRKFWPQQWLPSEPAISRARIMSYGYDTRSAAKPIDMQFWAKSLLFEMKYARDTDLRRFYRSGRPIIFVAHSMGGLVVKSAYLMGASDPEYATLAASIKAVVFLATPHRPSHMAGLWNRVLRASNPSSRERSQVADLMRGSAMIQELNENFRHVCQNLEIVSFYETQLTDIGIKKMMVVEKESATLGVPWETSQPLHADHRNMCRFDSEHDADYISIKNVLEDLLQRNKGENFTSPVYLPPEISYAPSPVYKGLAHDTSPSLLPEGSRYHDIDEKHLPYDNVRDLGIGGYGVVQEVRHRTTGHVYARKTCVLRRKNRALQREVFENEINVLRTLRNHRHMIHLYASYTTSTGLSLMLTPVADSGDLESFLEEFCDPTEEEVNDVARINFMTSVLERAFGCLADGLAYLRQRKIRHKDIKPRNILIHEGRVIYTDFGLSLDYSLHNNSVSSGPATMTRRYAAPEVVEGRTRDASSDIFSLGCVFVEIFSTLIGGIEYDESDAFVYTISTVHEQLRTATVPTKLQFLPEVIMGMTCPDPAARWTATKVSKCILANPQFSCEHCGLSPAWASNDAEMDTLAPG